MYDEGRFQATLYCIQCELEKISGSLEGIDKSLASLAQAQEVGWKRLVAVPYGTPTEFLAYKLRETLESLASKLFQTPHWIPPLEYLAEEIRCGLKGMVEAYIKGQKDENSR